MNSFFSAKKILAVLAFAGAVQAQAQWTDVGLPTGPNNAANFSARLGRVSVGQLLAAAPPVNNDFRLRVFGGPIAQVQNGTYGNFSLNHQWIGLGQNPVLSTIYGLGMFRDSNYAFYNLQNVTRNSALTRDLIIGLGSTKSNFDGNQRILIKGFFSPAGANSRILASFNPGTGAMGLNEENPISTMFINGTATATTAAFRNLFLLTTGSVSTPANVVASTYTSMGPEGNNPLTLNSNGFRAQSGNNAGNTGLIAANFTVNTTNQLPTQAQEAEIQWQDLNTNANPFHGFTGAANDLLSVYFRNNVNTANQRRRVMTFAGGGHVGINNFTGAPVTTANPINLLPGSPAFGIVRLHVNQGSVLASGYYATSDASTKQDITDIANPMGQLMALQPRAYRQIVNTGYPDQPSLVPQFGFIAQEVAATETNRVVARMDDGLLAVDYDQFTALLTAGVQQQQTTITAQQATIDQLKQLNELQQKQIDALNEWSIRASERLGIPPPTGVVNPGPNPTPVVTGGRFANGASATGENSAIAGVTENRLLQNTPNPSNGYTEIFYSLQEGVVGAINVLDQQGRIRKTFNNLPRGNSKVVINRGDLQPGTYTYTLLTNGQVVASKQLIIVR